MDIPDAVLGKLISVTTLTIFTILAFWINSYPFIDEGELYWILIELLKHNIMGIQTNLRTSIWYMQTVDPSVKIL